MKIKGLRWWIITLIGVATIINYIDRAALSIMWPAMGKDLDMNDGDYALILNMFMIAYALGQSLSGSLFDKIGTRMGYVVAIFVWSLSSLLHFAAKGFTSLAIVRLFLGVSEAGNWPGAAKSNAEWFPMKERAVAQGIFNAGASIGSVIAPLFIAFMYSAYGWKTTFIIIGSMGFLWIIPWLIINKKLPKEHPWITEEEQAYIDDSGEYIEGETTVAKYQSFIACADTFAQRSLGRSCCKVLFRAYLVAVCRLDATLSSKNVWV
jgi:ACS family hexuronate transporter-like MFS transporter